MPSSYALDGYKPAVAIGSKSNREVKRDRMLYLLRKTSDSQELVAALEKIRDEQGC